MGVRQMLATIDSHELSEWIGFFTIEHEDMVRARAEAEVRHEAPAARRRAAQRGGR